MNPQHSHTATVRHTRRRLRCLLPCVLVFLMWLWPAEIEELEPALSFDARRLPEARVAVPQGVQGCLALHERLARGALVQKVRASKARDVWGERSSEVWQRVNAVRARYNMPPLRRSALLGMAAALHARDMAERSYREHTSPEGCTLFQRVVSFLEYPSGGVAENLAVSADGPQSAATVVDSWLESPGHRMNMLHPEYVETGIALAQAPNGSLAWVQVFGDGDTQTAFERGRLGCQEGYVALVLPQSFKSTTSNTGGGVGTAQGMGVSVCASLTHVAGPFASSLVEACKARSAKGQGSLVAGGKTPPVCDAPRWPRALFFELLSLQDEGLCASPASLDAATGYCVQAGKALGPFPASLRVACEAAARVADTRSQKAVSKNAPKSLESENATVCEEDVWPLDILHAARKTADLAR